MLAKIKLRWAFVGGFFYAADGEYLQLLCACAEDSAVLGYSTGFVALPATPIPLYKAPNADSTTVCLLKG